MNIFQNTVGMNYAGFYEKKMCSKVFEQLQNMIFQFPPPS